MTLLSLSTEQTLDLGGEWTLRCVGNGETALRATVPGCVHLDLMAAGNIPDPFDRANELEVQWVGQADWEYAREFEVPASLLAHRRVMLVAEGLDTLATVRLNGRPVATTANMFRAWEWDVREWLREGTNTLAITFASAECAIEKLQRTRPIGTMFYPGSPQLRKEPCNFGWDWGPTLVTCGVWRPIRLVGHSGARLGDVQILQDHSRRGQVKLNVDVAAQAHGHKGLQARAVLSFGEQPVATAQGPLNRGKAALELTVKQPRLWWPNGMGEQPLYELQVELLDGEETVLDRDFKTVGLRTLELDRTKDRWGESFQFRVNGRPFFAKGANWIPADVFHPRLTREDYAGLLEDAAAVHMNMIRVWGGGVYEEDVFYELCDRLGLCVWQDFMFACNPYPLDDSAFVTEVQDEVEQNVRRLRHHACLALWCGNNELEQGWVAEQADQGHNSWADYSAWFDRQLPWAVRRLDPQRAYWPSSPHSPHGERTQFNNPAWGDAHVWDVWHMNQPFEFYRTCQHRFVSEFGFQSFPQPRTVETYTQPADRNITSFVMEQHQKNGAGNTKIIHYMADWFRLPARFEMFLWLSQILQAQAMQTGVEHFRANMPRTMGALYWQLNDCWPVASWASIEYGGRWKALHYAAARFFAPLMICAQAELDSGRVEVTVVSDLAVKTPVAWEWQLTDLSGRALEQGGGKVMARPGTSGRLGSLKLDKALERCGARGCILWLRLLKDGECISRNAVLFAPPKHLELERAEFRVTSVRRAGAGEFELTLAASKPALWVWLELEGADARFSQNFFHLQPGDPLTVRVRPAQPGLSVAQFKAQLTVRSLVDTYAEASV